MTQATNCNNHIQYSYIGYDKQDLERYTNIDKSIKKDIMIDDIMRFCRVHGIKIDKIAVLTDFRVAPNHRNKGIGRKGIKETVHYLKACGYDLIIFKSMISHLDCSEMPNNNKFLDIQADQGYFLEKNGFRNINSLCHMEWCIPYVYVDSDSKEFVSKMIRLDYSELWGLGLV